MIKNKTIIMFIFFIIGILLLLYPFISNYYNNKIQSKLISNYINNINTISNTEYNNIINNINKYNLELLSINNPINKKYTYDFNITSNNILGYIEIDKLNIRLPIYKGTSEQVLSMGVGLLEGSSIPIGGESTHAVLSAHRGLPQAKLFTDLDNLLIGDIIKINILNKTLTYQVDNINIVIPTDTNKLNIEKDKDYLTLMTCTPYGINSHRLLIRSIRINTPDNSYIINDAIKLNKLISISIILIPIIIIYILTICIRK